MKTCVYTLLATLLCIATPLFAQGTGKKPVTKADYGLWGRLVLDLISEKGEWVSYYMNYDHGEDTLFVEHTNKLKKYIFPASHSGVFTKDNYFLYHKQDGMALLDLNTGKTVDYPGAVSGKVSSNGEYVVVAGTFPSNVTVSDIHGQPLKIIPIVSAMSWSHSQNAVLCSYMENGVGKVGILHLSRDLKMTPILETDSTSVSLTWNHDDSAVAFYTRGKGKYSYHQLYLYSIKKQMLQLLNDNNEHFPHEMAIQEAFFAKLQVSKDGNRVFFGLRNAKKKTYDKHDSDVEIWYGDSKRLYPIEHFKDTLGYSFGLGVWSVRDNSVHQITQDDEEYVMIADRENFAVVGDPRKYAPNYKYDDDLDLYLVDLKTGKKQLIVEKISEAPSQTVLSPDGLYLIYYKESNWWSYSLLTHEHRDLTSKLNVGWDNHEYDPGSMLSVHGVAGWTGTSQVIINDRYDLWSIDVTSGKTVRLTRGREQRQRFRIHSPMGNPFNYSGRYLRNLDFSKDILLEVFAHVDSSTGFAYYNAKQGLHSIYLNASKTSRHRIAGDVHVYVEERYDLSPQLTIRKDRGEPVVKVASNLHQKNYAWGSARLFSYTNSKGDELGGALYLPADYDGTKSYPMVVYIYEQLSQEIHDYVIPDLTTGNGFNVTNLVSNGYIVMMPDFAWVKGASGTSALDCVTSAVHKILATENIDSKRVGLFGHSFGGFEASFIVTQSNLFAAAISGAGPTDLISFSLTMEHSALGPDIWRVENYQFRMGKSIYEDMQAYFNNSALYHADKMNTPLLLFAGSLDKNVGPQQSMAFYFALRRLSKPVVLLQYPDEGHINISPENSADLATRVLQWFDYHLKGDVSPKWILNTKT